MILLWPNHYDEQAEYVNTMEQVINRLHRKSIPATYVGTSRPTSAQMANAWSLKEGQTLSIPPYSKTQWYNPELLRVENLFFNDPTLGSDPLGVQVDENALASTELIGTLTQKQGDGAAATYTASWSKVYRKISFFWSVRSTLAAIASTFLIRPNALATAIYNHAASKIDQSGVTAQDTAVAATSWAVGSIPGATAPNANVFGQGFGEIYFLDAATPKVGFFESLWLTNDGSGAAEMRYNHGGWVINTTAALTSILFTPQTGFAVGSKIIVFGHNPTT